MMIEDGTGKGNKTKVNDDNQLETFSTCIDVLESLNETSGAVWVLPMDAVAPSGATKFLYLLNNGTSQIGVAAVRMQSTVAGIFRFTKVIGTAAGGTNLTAVPLNLGSTIVAPAGAQTGTSITGLTDAGLLLPLYLQANVMFSLDLPGRWYLAPNTALAIQAPGAATVNGIVLIYSEVE